LLLFLSVEKAFYSESFMNILLWSNLICSFKYLWPSSNSSTISDVQRWSSISVIFCGCL